MAEYALVLLLNDRVGKEKLFKQDNKVNIGGKFRHFWKFRRFSLTKFLNFSILPSEIFKFQILLSLFVISLTYNGEAHW